MGTLQDLSLLGGVALAALATPAIAQQVEQSGRPAMRAGNEIGEIIVTAQRRAERIQDVPIAISAFSSEQIDRMNISEPQDLYGSVPSLVVGSQGNASRDVQSFTIRGQSTGFLSSPAVAMYLAEVPVPAAVTLALQGAPGMFFDLENVQVLSGPQGTLFGRNTTGGAVLFAPRKPTSNLEGYVEGRVGNYNLHSIEGAINIPLVKDVLMVRAAGAYQDRKGYTKDLVWNKDRDDVHWYSGRIGVLFTPDDRLENYLIAYRSKSDNNGAGFIHNAFNYPVLKGVGFCADAPTAPGPIGVPCDVYREQTKIAGQIGPRKTRGAVDGFSRIRTWGVINTTSYELSDELTLKNIVSFQKLKVNYAVDQDGTPLQQYDAAIQNAKLPNFPIPGISQFGLPLLGSYANADPNFKLPRDAIKQLTEELQIQGSFLDKRLTFAGGGFYYSAKPDGLWGSKSATFCPALYTGLCQLGEAYSGVANKSKALYAQGTLDLGVFSPSLENLRLTGGYRYTWDTVTGFNTSWRAGANQTAICSATGAIVPASSASAECRFDAKLKSNAPTWTIGADYKPVRNLLLYGKVSHGYKAGGFNTSSVRVETQTFNPESLTSYEVGFKSDWRLGDVPVRFNATYYYSDYANIQRPSGDFNTVTGAQGAQVLSASARVQGFEAEASIRPIKEIEIGGNVSYTDGRYKKFEQNVVAPLGQLACNSTVVGGNVLPVPQGGVADYSCNRMHFVTPWIFNVHANIDFPLPETLGDLSLFVNYSHVSSQRVSPLPSSVGGVPVEPGIVLAPYGLLKASLDWSNINGSGLDIGLFATNLTNKLYKVGGSGGVFQSLGVLSDLYGEPRMYGLKLRYHFGS